MSTLGRLVAGLASCAALSALPACSLANAGTGHDGARGDGSAAANAMPGPDAGARLATPPDAGSPILEDEATPPSSSEDLNARARHLLEAIVQDNPQLAGDIELPRDAYVSSRETNDPTRAWEKGVNSGFVRSVHGLHKRLKVTERAQFVSIELGRSISQVAPRKKEWTKPLWKVRHSRVTFTLDGKMQRVDIGEMMGWRGAWYVTKLR